MYSLLDKISRVGIIMSRMDGHLCIWLLSVVMKDVLNYCCPNAFIVRNNDNVMCLEDNDGDRVRLMLYEYI